MRKLNWLLFLVLLILIPVGCAPAKKPTPEPEPKTIVVPDVSKITFETIDYDQAPDIVQALAKNLKEKHFATWTAVNGKNYIIVSQNNLPAGSTVQITEIERRIPANDFDWINVKLKYADIPNGKKTDTEKPLVATFNIDRTVKAVGFELDRKASPARTPASPPSVSEVETTETKKGLTLDAPRPGERISGPVRVSGSANGVEGTVRIRLKDSNGVTLAEKPVQVTSGKFSTTMSFSSPPNEEKGIVEAFVTGDGGVEKDMVSVPVTLLPSTTPEPEPIGAP